MDFESLKEQFLERFNVYKSQVEESELYIRLKEKYDTLSPQMQKVIKITSSIVVAYFFYSIPARFVTSASEKMEFFEENRQLTRELIRAGRVDKGVKLPPSGPSATALQGRVDGILNAESVLPEQKMSVSPQENIASKSLVPKSIKQSGIKASIKQLNLRQVVRVGEALNDINSTQLMNISINADQKDPHYYSVEYEVATFEVPRDPVIENTKKGGKPSKFKKKKGKKNKKKRGSK